MRLTSSGTGGRVIVRAMERATRSTRWAALYITKWLLVSSAVGIGGGVAAVVLRLGIRWVAAGTTAVPLWIAPALGGLIVSILGYWDPQALGFGTDRYIKAVNRRHGDIPARTALSKMIGTVATLGFRGSGGLEGPMVLIGGSIANVIDHLPGVRRVLSDYDRRILTVCGAAGAIGAVFHSPLAGGIFAVEVLYRSSLHYVDLFPAMLSSTMGFVVYGLIHEAVPLLVIPDYIPDVRNVALFVLTGLFSGFVSYLFIGVFEQVGGLFRRLPIVRLHPVLGGLVAGLLLTTTPEAAGIGLDVVQSLIFAVRPLRILVVLCLVKMLATAVTVGSGGSAGLVIPALFIGAISGNSVAAVFGLDGSGVLASLVITGMAASLASVANVPVTAAVLLVELVGLRLGVPATIGAITGYMVGKQKVIYGGALTYESEFADSRLMQSEDRTLGH